MKRMFDKLVDIVKVFTKEVGGKPDYFVTKLYSRFDVDRVFYIDNDKYDVIIKYLKDVVIPHKIAVYNAGEKLIESNSVNYLLTGELKTELYRNLWLHDMSKFSANEMVGYAFHDFKNPNDKTKEQFEAAWHHHKMNNPHHPEYWLNPNRGGVLEPLPMPNIYIIEMIADWIGAGQVYGSTLEEWLPKNIGKFKFANRGKVAEIIRDSTGINVVMEDGKLVVE